MEKACLIVRYAHDHHQHKLLREYETNNEKKNKKTSKNLKYIRCTVSMKYELVQRCANKCYTAISIAFNRDTIWTRERKSRNNV